MLKTVYLDHNATTPLHPELKPKVLEWLDIWGNPSSIHWAGRGPKTVLREARRRIAELLGVDPLELVITSGGSEANNLVFKGLLAQSGSSRERNQIIVSGVEHPSVLKTAMAMKEYGYSVDILTVSRDGNVDMDHLQTLLGPRTALVSCMLANNETGHIFPVAEIAKCAHSAGALVHCDAVQGLGKVDLNLRSLGVDLATISGHKFYALKGCGVLFARKGLNLKSLIHGGSQERGRRAGTENILATASLGFMCTHVDLVTAQISRLRSLRDHLEARILAEIPDVQITGKGGSRLSNTSHMTISGIDGETLLINLDVQGFAVSTGAACSSGSPEPSATLLAMGYSRAEAQSSLRLSLGWQNQKSDIDTFVDTLKQVTERLRGFNCEKGC